MSGLVAKEKRRATEERRPPTHPRTDPNWKSRKFAIHKVAVCPNGFLGMSFNEGTIIFLMILLDKTVPVG